QEGSRAVRSRIVQDGQRRYHLAGQENSEELSTPGPGLTSDESVSSAKYSVPVAVAWISRSASAWVTATVTMICPPEFCCWPLVLSPFCCTWLEVMPSVPKTPTALTST